MDSFNTEERFDTLAESEEILECLSIPDEIFDPISDSEWADLPIIDNHLSGESINDQIGRGDADREPPAKRSRYQCEVCKKTFSRSNNLKRHQKFHVQDEKSFECRHCAKKFRRAYDLKRHEKIHEKRTVERLYKCGTCGEEFGNAAPYRAHIKSVHGEKRKLLHNDQYYFYLFTAPLKKAGQSKKKDRSDPQENSVGSSWQPDPFTMPSTPPI